MMKKLDIIQTFTDLEHKMTVNIGTIHGGTASGSVPAHCEAKIDLRASRVADMETLKKKIEEVLAKYMIPRRNMASARCPASSWAALLTHLI